MLNKKLLAVALLTAFSTSSFADTAGDTHNIDISVDEVALLDIAESGTDGTPAAGDAADPLTAFTCTINTSAVALGDSAIAGENFVCTATAHGQISYSMTTNIGVNSTLSRTLVVGLSAPALGIDPTWKLVATPVPDATVAGTGIANASAGTVAASAALPITSVTTVAAPLILVEGIKNAVTTAGTITYTLAPTHANVAMAYTGTNGSTTADGSRFNAKNTITLAYTLTDD